MGRFLQKDGWMRGKHMMLTKAPAKTKSGRASAVQGSLGGQIPPPSLTEDPITWIDLDFHPQAEIFPHQLGPSAFSAHGEAVACANTGPVQAGPLRGAHVDGPKAWVGARPGLSQHPRLMGEPAGDRPRMDSRRTARTPANWPASLLPFRAGMRGALPSAHGRSSEASGASRSAAG